MSANDLETVLGDNQRLRIENDKLRHERDTARRERDLAIRLNEIEETVRIRIEIAWRSERDEAREERDEAIRERDEARRWFCRAGFKTERAARAKASKRNWDCFKDETQ